MYYIEVYFSHVKKFWNDLEKNIVDDLKKSTIYLTYEEAREDIKQNLRELGIADIVHVAKKDCQH